MRAYCGQTREMGLVRKLADHGIGECTVRGELKSRKRDPWFYDNGAFRDWKAGSEFNGVQFARDMRRIRYGAFAMPDFVVVPDIVAGGLDSLAFSRSNRDEIGQPSDERNPLAYLAVQDGMTVVDVRRFLDESAAEFGHAYAGIFVGGTLAWKLETAASWVEFAHSTDRRCHVGRVGPPARVAWARSIGADSIDSCLPIMYAEHLEPFLAALEVS
jgi:hypothetical protein